MTSVIFCDWFQNCFVSEVETYLKKNNLYFKAVLVLDNAQDHPYELGGMHPHIKVAFLSPWFVVINNKHVMIIYSKKNTVRIIIADSLLYRREFRVANLLLSLT